MLICVSNFEFEQKSCEPALRLIVSLTCNVIKAINYLLNGCLQYAYNIHACVALDINSSGNNFQFEMRIKFFIQ